MGTGVRVANESDWERNVDEKVVAICLSLGRVRLSHVGDN